MHRAEGLGPKPPAARLLLVLLLVQPACKHTLEAASTRVLSIDAGGTRPGSRACPAARGCRVPRAPLHESLVAAAMRSTNAALGDV
jgi:hypothetical protein